MIPKELQMAMYIIAKTSAVQQSSVTYSFKKPYRTPMRGEIGLSDEEIRVAIQLGEIK